MFKFATLLTLLLATASGHAFASNTYFRLGTPGLVGASDKADNIVDATVPGDSGSFSVDCSALGVWYTGASNVFIVSGTGFATDISVTLTDDNPSPSDFYTTRSSSTQAEIHAENWSLWWIRNSVLKISSGGRDLFCSVPIAGNPADYSDSAFYFGGMSPMAWSSAGGEQVVILGTGLQTLATADYDGGGSFALADYAVAGPHTARTFTTPAIAPGYYTLHFCGPSLVSGECDYTYVPLHVYAAGTSPGWVISSVTPSAGPGTGTITITGDGFSPWSEWFIDGNPVATSGGVGNTVRTIDFTGLADGQHTVTVADGAFHPGNPLAGLFSTEVIVQNIDILGYLPATLASAGGTLVTVTGSDFTPSMTATLNGSALTINYVSATEITFTSPALPIGNATLVLQDGGTNTDTATLTVTGAFTVSGLSANTVASDGSPTIYATGTGLTNILAIVSASANFASYEQIYGDRTLSTSAELYFAAGHITAFLATLNDGDIIYIRLYNPAGDTYNTQITYHPFSFTNFTLYPDSAIGDPFTAVWPGQVVKLNGVNIRGLDSLTLNYNNSALSVRMLEASGDYWRVWFPGIAVGGGADADVTGVDGTASAQSSGLTFASVAPAHFQEGLMDCDNCTFSGNGSGYTLSSTTYNIGSWVSAAVTNNDYVPASGYNQQAGFLSEFKVGTTSFATVVVNLGGGPDNGSVTAAVVKLEGLGDLSGNKCSLPAIQGHTMYIAVHRTNSLIYISCKHAGGATWADESEGASVVYSQASPNLEFRLNAGPYNLSDFITYAPGGTPIYSSFTLEVTPDMPPSEKLDWYTYALPLFQDYDSLLPGGETLIQDLKMYTD